MHRWDGSIWNQLGDKHSDGERAFNASGHFVDLSGDGDIVAIGAISDDGNGNTSCHVLTVEMDGLGISLGMTVMENLLTVFPEILWFFLMI